MNKVFKSLSKLIPDKLFLSIKFRLKLGRFINWKNPTTFNEKLQWLKIYNRNPEYSKLVDKYEVRKYVEDKIGEEYLIPLIAVWDSVDEIDFDSLPEQFVLKCTHDCGSVIICKNRAEFDFEAAKAKLSRAMKKNYYWGEREWPYKNVKPRIIAEEFMVDESGTGLKDYKLFCFDGVMKSLFIATDRNVPGIEVKFDFFDSEFNHLSIRNGHDNSPYEIKCPSSFEQMKELAFILSKDIPHARVDFYDINGKIYFGEITLFHFGGFVKFEPQEWDKTFGDWLKLPQKRKGKKK